jgi:hypothetical protein
MKPISTIQEILLFTGTSFSKREFSQLGNHKKPDPKPQHAELEQACWSGILFEMLPELSSLFAGSKAFIWDIHSFDHFLLVTQGTRPEPIDNAFSVDPHFFLTAAAFN